MSLANEMRNISDNAINEDVKLLKAYEEVIDNIKKAARDGKREVVFPYFKYETLGEYFEMKDKIKNKLSDDGFRVCKGSSIGKGMGNWETEYVVW